MHVRRHTPSIWRSAMLAATVSAAFAAGAPRAAHAGFLDFLFGGFQQRPAPPVDVNAYAEPSAPIIAAPRRSENIRQAGGEVRAVAFCVRLCDGQHFPMERMRNATPVETCRSMCPASKTKVFFGSQIDHAVARDGERYAALDAAYVYRDHLVPHCTCNGRNAFGLAPIDVKSDPTLRPGDIVSSENGLLAYTGKRGGQVAEFTPVHLSVDAAAAGVGSSRARVGRREAGPAMTEEASATIPQPQPDRHADMHTAWRAQSAR